MGRSRGNAPYRPRNRMRVLAGLLVFLAGLAVFIWSVSRNPDPDATGDPGSRDLRVVSQVPVAERDDESAEGPLRPELPLMSRDGPFSLPRMLPVMVTVPGPGPGQTFSMPCAGSIRETGLRSHPACTRHPFRLMETARTGRRTGRSR